MARSPSSNPQSADFRHEGEKRSNIPPAKIAAEGKIPKVPKATYRYSPHLPPVLRFDRTGKADRLPALLDEATRRKLTPEEARTLAEALRTQEPWLEWANKQEEHDRGGFLVDPVALHIHERVSAQACIRAAMREDAQRGLFADPQQPYQQAVQFYKHKVDWANRLILGDSLQVMSSLARREGLAGKVQMIYMDPPYGIKFGSNFQPEVGNRDVKEKDTDLTRQPEMVRAYRDTWKLGVHSYLSYLRDRLVVARDLLTESGSIFVQIGDENLHRVRAVADEVFGADNFVTVITVKKTAGLSKGLMPEVIDFLLWYARDAQSLKRKTLFVAKDFDEDGAYRSVELPNGEHRSIGADDLASAVLSGRLFRQQILLAAGRTPSCVYPIEAFGGRFDPTAGRSWATNPAGMRRLLACRRVERAGSTLAYLRFASDNPVNLLQNLWADTASGSGMEKVYVVQTNTKVVERCLLMTTDPGDLVLDPTCGSGTTAFVAEQWGRRWITTDTSRVAIAIARQRLLTSRFEHYKTKGKPPSNQSSDPGTGFQYKTVPHITLKSIAQNANLDPIFARHEPILDAALLACNTALAGVPKDVRARLQTKLATKERAEGKRAISDADRRRWALPADRFEHWTAPFDTDPDWPKALQDAVAAYRKAWRKKMDEVDACIQGNAEQEELVDQPEKVPGVVRVTGPFTVEGVMPEELSLGEEGLFDGTPDEGEVDDGAPAAIRDDGQNLHAYLDSMLEHLRRDGVTFLGNQQKRFARVEALFEEGSGSGLHADGAWEGADEDGANTVAIAFGPQYGPVTAAQVEELVRACRRYDELVIAGFSFDAAACGAIQESQHPKLRVHQAFIRPDAAPSMDGLLDEKNRRKGQLFTVFGQPEIDVKPAAAGAFTVELLGVDVYDPLGDIVHSKGADKVAAWFLDQDFDGRCFCITQAFFPDRDAWEKVAAALKGRANEDAFKAFSGTVSLPFQAGAHKRIAVKVIDPRGNEVMAIRKLG